MRYACPLPQNPAADGYVRLPERALGELQLEHVDSGLDEALLAELRADSVDAVSAGYTEWQRTRHPGAAYLSVGWDWYLDRASGALLVAWGDVRSNIMCIDPGGADIGMKATARALMRRLAQINWPNAVARAARVRFWRPDARDPSLQ
ncbi:MAG TPA: DUF4902 domain-containing protein [Trinickia sp.]|nr:DUF4902 domain-containing protein [Trinickia sp.]